MKTYLFIAEMEHDTDDLPAIFHRHGISGVMTFYPSVLVPDHVIPGWMVELKTEASAEDILAAFEEVPDSHIMERTLEERPVSLNFAAEYPAVKSIEF